MPKQPLFAFGLSFYNDADSLKRCLQSIFWNRELMRNVPFKMILIDGKYKGYPARSALSDDGSRDIALGFIEDYPHHCEKLYDYPNLHERHKRQKYLDIAASKGIPFLVQIDSDEYLDVKPPQRIAEFVEELKLIEDQWNLHNQVTEDGKLVRGTIANVHPIRCIDMDTTGMYPINVSMRPKVWYRPQDMVYTTKHFYYKNRHLDESKMSLDELTSFRVFNINSLVIYHDHSLRDRERELKMKFYEYERLPRLEGSSRTEAT